MEKKKSPIIFIFVFLRFSLSSSGSDSQKLLIQDCLIMFSRRFTVCFMTLQEVTFVCRNKGSQVLTSRKGGIKGRGQWIN